MCRTLKSMAAILLLGMGTASAQEPGDPAHGLALARSLCASCHVVGPDQLGPVPDGVPSFETIAATPGMDAAMIEARLIRPQHPQMPTPPLDRQQTRDVVAYILSLGP